MVSHILIALWCFSLPLEDHLEDHRLAQAHELGWAHVRHLPLLSLLYEAYGTHVSNMLSPSPKPPCNLTHRQVPFV